MTQPLEDLLIPTPSEALSDLDALMLEASSSSPVMATPAQEIVDEGEDPEASTIDRMIFAGLVTP